MQLNHPVNTLDIVFIGSSRSYFHIDTGYLTAQGLPSYNLSMLACFPLSFPSMIEHAKTVSPQAIGLGVDVDFFYNDFEDRVPTPGIADIKAQIAAGLDTAIISRTILDYVEKLPPLSRFATTIATKGQSVFDRLANGYFEQKKSDTVHSAKTQSAPEFDTDSKIFQVQKLKDDYYSVKCENGDGILFGAPLMNNATAFSKRNPPQNLRLKNIDFMNYLISIARKGGTDVFIYLCARVDSPDNYDLKKLRSLLNAPVIDTVRSVPGNPLYWGDLGHLNSKGREIYTKNLMSEITQTFAFKRNKTLQKTAARSKTAEVSE